MSDLLLACIIPLTLAVSNSNQNTYSTSLSIAPSPPLNATTISKTSTRLTVGWVSPAIPDGVLSYYEVTYTGVSSVNPVPNSFYQSLSNTIPAPSTSLVLSDLVPYSNYSISVRAFTSAGPGEYSEVIEDRTEEDGESIYLCVT